MIDTNELLDPYVYDGLSDRVFSANLEQCGYESLWLLSNTSFLHWTLVAHATMFVLGAILIYLFCTTKKSSWFRRVFIGYFIWNGLVRLFMETFVDLLLAATLNITQVPWVDTWSSLNQTEKYSIGLSLAILAAMICLLLFFSVHYYRNFYELKENVSAMLSGVRYTEKKKTRALLFVPFIFFLRRIVFMVVTLFSSENFVVQLIAMLTMSTIMFAYVVRVRPLETTRANRIEIMNEVTMILLAHTMFLFSDYVKDRERVYDIGWVYTTTSTINITIHLVVILSNTTSNVKFFCKKKIY